MAGHSKWANIKHRKSRVDEKKGKLFSKLLREIMIAAKLSGSSPESNLRLKVAIQKAREANVPSESINRAIQRGAGELSDGQLEEVFYEGYGPGGVAIYVSVVTNNKNRTASEIRHIFSKNGANLGEIGCVAWMFEKKGFIVIDVEATKKSEDDLLMISLEAGVEDFKREGNSYEVITSAEELHTVKEVFEERGIVVSQAEVTMIPKTTVSVRGKEAEQVLKLVEALEEHDDVQNVYSNFDIPEEDMERLAGI